MDKTNASSASSASPPPPAPHGQDARARLVMLGTGPAVRFERVLSGAAPQEVWSALTDRDGLRGWFPCSVEAERWQVGGTLTFRFPGGADLSVDGVVLECEPPRVLAYLWGEETLRFELEPLTAVSDAGTDTDNGSREPAGTRLVLTDELAAPSAARNAAGWHVCLDRLSGATSAHDPEGAQHWQRLFAAYSAAFEPVLGPQEGPPAGFEDRV